MEPGDLDFGDFLMVFFMEMCEVGKQNMWISRPWFHWRPQIDGQVGRFTSQLGLMEERDG